MRSVVIDDEARVELRASLDEIVREGVRRMLAVALEAEAGAYVAALVGEVDERGHRLVVRNGCARERTVTTVAGGGRHRGAAGARPACRPGERAAAAVPQRDRAAVVLQEPEGGRGTPAAVPAGLSSGDFVPALTEFFGSGAGLSASVITRLIRHWQDERTAFARRRLHAADYVYVCADGVHFNVRLEEERLCCLVIVGVRADGTKELVAIADGYRESTASWVDLLRDLKRRGMRAPVLAVGDGALREVFPATRGQRCGCTSWPTSSMPCRNRLSRRRAVRWPRSATPRTATTQWAPSPPSLKTSRSRRKR